ncbi:Homeobox-leucine zipper protein GLABRA 2 [Linum grandiflorum]
MLSNDFLAELFRLFKESPHPDEKQRQQLSKQLGLAPRQVKFWFQNRRTQIKAIQERHENSILKAEIDKLRDDNKFLRDTIAAAKNVSGCPKCGGGDHPLSDDKHLRVENAKLKAEVENLRMLVEKHTPLGGTRTATTSSESSEHHQQNQERTNNNNTASTTKTMSLDFYSRVFGLEKAKIQDVVNQAMEELQKMATARDPLWVRSVETCREMLNYDEYLKQFGGGGGSMAKAANVEASRDHGLVFVELQRLVNCFMDVNQWKEMFPCLIAKAATVDVICAGDDRTGNGAVQLMFAEVQMLTPMVPTREVYFVRYCKQLGAEEWGIVDVSIDEVEENIDVKCRKRPSGCIIHDQSNGHCKVVWVEHLECKKTGVSSMYRTVVNSGLAFGATRWLSALQLQCERLLFFMATNVPTKDSTGVATLAGRKSMLRLAERMTSSFCCAIGASSSHNWTKVTSKTGVEVRVSSRKNLNDTGEPFGVILCAVSSVWLPVSPPALFDFLRDEAHRNEWDIMSDGGPVKSLATLAKGQDKGNSVTLQMMKANENATWILQDSCTNAYESMIVYAPVDIPGMKTVVTGCDSSSIAILPSGFSILHDGLDSRTQVITSLEKEQGSGGSLLTIAFQILTSSIPAAKLTLDSVESVSAFISCTLRNIKRSLECDES